LSEVAGVTSEQTLTSGPERQRVDSQRVDSDPVSTRRAECFEGGMRVFQEWHRPLSMDAISSIVGEKGKEGMEGGTEK